MRTTFRALAVALSLLFPAAAIVRAETPVAPPAGMTQAQYDALVDAISTSVAQKLKADGGAPAAKSGKAATPPAKVEVSKLPARSGPSEVALFAQRAGKVVRAYPELGHQLALLVGAFEGEANRSRGALGFVLLLSAIGAAAVVAEATLRRLLARTRDRLAAGAAPELGMRSLLNLGALWLLDGLGVLAVWLICSAGRAWFDGGTTQDQLAEAVLAGIFDWRLYMLPFRFVLQPDVPAARLCAADSDAGRALYSRVAIVMLILIIGRTVGLMLVANGLSTEARAAYQVSSLIPFAAALLWLVFRSQDAARQWFGGLGRVAPLAGVVGRHWTGVASTFFVALAVTQIYSAISGRVQVGGAMLLTLILVVGLLFFETLMQAFVRRLDSQLPGRTAASDSPKLPDVIARCVRVAVLIGVVAWIAESWVVEVFGLASPDQWEDVTRSSRIAAASLFLGFVAWELFKYATDPYMARVPKGPGEAAADDGAAAPASRISTMMPLLRMAAAILIVFVAVVIALEDFGVNVMPLIAGASIFGIAISFGSQTLVRDIVSGIFYLTDDAFRVGEYVDAGRAKGTVEGFTLRSIKLRHQNGQVHTIPFGQLGQITNFSRDWITVKFNLRFARDTDIEKLRKAAKKIGQDMMEMPAIKSEILAPFKMQGVADIVENALLVRFKFTAKPGNPAMIQREAIKRLFNTLPTMGIEFAKEGAAVIVQAAPASADGGSAGAPNAPVAAPVPAAAG